MCKIYCFVKNSSVSELRMCSGMTLIWKVIILCLTCQDEDKIDLLKCMVLSEDVTYIQDKV